MNSVLPDHLQSIVDTICERGCAEVNHCIDALQQGKTDGLTQSLSATEQQIVLRELKCIMAVYEQKH